MQSIRERRTLDIDTESDIHLAISSLKNIDEFGDAISQNLKQVMQFSLTTLFLF